MRTTTTRLQHPIPIRAQIHRRHSKVSNLDVLIFVQEEIFWLEVTMTDVEVVTIIETSNDLLEIVGSF